MVVRVKRLYTVGLKKIEALWEKKLTYEDVLNQQLDNLNGDFSTLKMQAQELMVRNSKNQMQMPLVE